MMRRHLFGLVLLGLLALPSSAQVPGMFQPLLQAPSGPAVATYVTSAADATSQTTYTLSGVSIGAASDDRCVIVGLGSRANSAQSIASVTIAGNAANLVVSGNATTGGADVAALYGLRVPTGTTANIVVTFSGAMLRLSASVWKVTGTSTCTASATNSSTGSIANGATRSASVNVPANGTAIGATWGGGAGNPTLLVAWSVLSSDVSLNTGTPSNVYSGAHNNYTAAQTPLAVQTTNTGSLSNISGTLISASWGP